MIKRVGLLLFLIGALNICRGQDGLISVNGTKLFFKTYGSGEPILVIHGGPGLNHSYLLPHLEKLSKNFRIVLYDQRACGKSAIPSTDSVSLKFFAQDVEGIRIMLGVESLNILAHSWGAIPAVAYAKSYRHRVKKLVLVSPVPLSKEYDAETFANQQKKINGRDSTDRSIILGSPNFKAGKSSAYRNLLMLSFRHSFYSEENYKKLKLELPENFLSASRVLNAGLGKDLSDYNFHESLKLFEFPVLIIHGAVDAIPLAAVTRIHSNIPKATLQIFNKSGHFPFIEESKKFKREVIAFFKE